MASKTQIANRMLKKVGAGRVNDIATENNKRANAVNDMFDIVRDAVLADAKWNFATKRVVLAPNGNTPAWGYKYEYDLPSDFIAVQEVKDEDNEDPRSVRKDWKEEDGKLVTDVEDAVYLKYTYRVEDTEKFSALFVEAFATAGALEIVEELTQSNTKKQLLQSDLDDIMEKAKHADAFAQQPELLDESEWITVRY